MGCFEFWVVMAVCVGVAGLWAWGSGFGWYAVVLHQDVSGLNIWSRAPSQMSAELRVGASWEWIGPLPGEVEAVSGLLDAEGGVNSALGRQAAMV
jgi:hypothetical protein